MERFHFPDAMERAEASAERHYFEMLQPDGKLKCDCGAFFDADDGGTLSADPYAMPVCPACVEKHFSEK